MKKIFAKLKKLFQNIKHDVEIRLYGYNRCVLDTILTLCYNRPVIQLSVFNDRVPSDSSRLLDYLEQEGMVKITNTTIEITVRGIIFHEEGGFKGKWRTQKFWNFVSLAALACAVVALVK